MNFNRFHDEDALRKTREKLPSDLIVHTNRSLIPNKLIYSLYQMFMWIKCTFWIFIALARLDGADLGFHQISGGSIHMATLIKSLYEISEFEKQKKTRA